MEWADGETRAFKISYLVVCLCVCMRARVHAHACMCMRADLYALVFVCNSRCSVPQYMWQAEDNVQISVLSFYFVCPKDLGTYIFSR